MKTTVSASHHFHLTLASRLFSLLVAVSIASHAIGQVPDLPGWDLVWNDEFDGTSLDTQKWTALNRRDSYNNEKQYYHPNQVAVTGGNLELTAINQSLAGKPYQSGLITSNDLFGPGRFEARIDLPTSQGMWPAFWLNSNHVAWPQGGEIDIMENRGSQPHLVSSAYHWQTNPGPCCDQHQYVFDEYTATEGGQPVDFHAGFHTYAAEWDDTTIRYYVDGNLYHTVTETANRPVFETPKNIIVNLAVGGIFGGDPDGTTQWPQTMMVDYVRYWQPDNSPPPPPQPGDNLLANPSFDDAGGSLNAWNDFGNTIPNVSANSSLTNNSVSALKIFGQFNGTTNESGASQGVAITGGESLTAVASSQSPHWDTLFGKNNEVTMKLEFYSQFGAASGSSSFLGEVTQLIHDGTTAQNIWHEHTIEAIAPANAAEARLSFVFEQNNNHNGAIWIDSTGIFLNALDGDFNGDGMVDESDYSVWLSALGQDESAINSAGDGQNGVDRADYALWKANYGNSTGSGAVSAAAIPEPAGLVLLCLSAVVFLLSQNRARLYL